MASRLERLADELILNVFEHLRPEQMRNHDATIKSQRANSIADLHSFCFVSRRLSLIVTAALFSEAVGSGPYEYQNDRTSPLLRMFMRNPDLAKHVTVVEYEQQRYIYRRQCGLECNNTKFLHGHEWKEQRIALRTNASTI
jgi:hypothetical protein